MQKKRISNNLLIPEIASLIEEGIKVKFIPTGSSMHPFINGDKDSVVLVPPEEIRKGDAVLAKTGDIYVLHRITCLNGDNITLMGDGNICGVEKCKRTDVIALVAEIVRGDRRINCRSNIYALRVWAWRILRPARRYLLAIYRRTH